MAGFGCPPRLEWRPHLTRAEDDAATDDRVVVLAPMEDPEVCGAKRLFAYVELKAVA